MDFKNDDSGIPLQTPTPAKEFCHVCEAGGVDKLTEPNKMIRICKEHVREIMERIGKMKEELPFRPSFLGSNECGDEPFMGSSIPGFCVLKRGHKDKHRNSSHHTSYDEWG